MNTSLETISGIINNISGKNIVARRIEALNNAGFKVSFSSTKYNWGRSGTVKEEKGNVLVQLKYATSGRGKNGYSVNHCDVYAVSAQ